MSNPINNPSSMAEFTPFQTQTPVNVSLLKPSLSIAADIT